MYSKQMRHGFTIVELLVVIVVIGILATITIIAYRGIQAKATDASLQSELKDSSVRLGIDQAIGGNFPATLQAANQGKGIVSKPGSTYEYVVNNDASTKTFCIALTKDGRSFKTSQDGNLLEGRCINDTAPSVGTVTPGTWYVNYPENSGLVAIASGNPTPVYTIQAMPVNVLSGGAWTDYPTQLFSSSGSTVNLNFDGPYGTMGGDKLVVRVKATNIIGTSYSPQATFNGIYVSD